MTSMQTNDRLIVLPTSRTEPMTLAALMQWLAPYITVAALAYPVLVWPLFEAEPAVTEGWNVQKSISDTPSALLRVYFSALFALGLLAVLAQPDRRRLGLTQLPLLAMAAFLAWAGVTWWWSVEPEATLRRLFLAIFISWAIIAGTLVTRDVDRVLRIAFWLFSIMVVINISSVLTTPATALGHAGIYPHKNYFGAITAVMMMFALFQAFTGGTWTRLVAISMLAAGLWFLIASQSKTSLALTVVAPPVAILVTLAARYVRVSPAVSVFGLAISLYGIYEFGVSSGFWDFHAAAHALFGDPTLTQRTEIWAFAVQKIEERPWFGYGYEVFWGAGWNSPSVREARGFVANMPHAHNGYVDLIVHTGLIGLGMFTVLMAAALHAAGRIASRSLRLASFVLTLLIFDLMHNFLESNWFRSYSLVTMILALASALAAALEAQRPEPEQRR